MGDVRGVDCKNGGHERSRLGETWEIEQVEALSHTLEQCDQYFVSRAGPCFCR